jgi:hypothetical protein
MREATMDSQLVHIEEWERHDGAWDSRNPEMGERASYGDILFLDARHSSEPCGQCYYMPELTGGSDYSGGSVTLANYRSMLESYRDYVVDLYGGHGTYAIAIPVWAFVCKPAIAETLAGLDDYPVIDEEALSDLESEWEQEAWESFVRHDFKCALENARCECLVGQQCHWCTLSDEDARALFEAAREASNTYWEYEHSGAWIDLDRILPHVA